MSLERRLIEAERSSGVSADVLEIVVQLPGESEQSYQERVDRIGDAAQRKAGIGQVLLVLIKRFR